MKHLRHFAALLGSASLAALATASPVLAYQNNLSSVSGYPMTFNTTTFKYGTGALGTATNVATGEGVTASPLLTSSSGAGYEIDYQANFGTGSPGVSHVVVAQHGAFTLGYAAGGYPQATYGAGSNAVTLTSSTAVLTNSFHHISLSIGPSGGTLRVDGTSVATSATSFSASTPTFTNVFGIGADSTAPSSQTGGFLDEVAVFSSATYNGEPSAAYTGSEPNEIALYHLDGAGTDSSQAAAATSYSLSGPASGNQNSASSNFTVQANGSLSSTVTITPSDGGAGGSFSPASVSLASGSVGASATFTYSPTSLGSITISTTNNGGLTNPSPLTYTSTGGVTFTADNANFYCSKDNTFVDTTNHWMKTISGGAYCKTSFTGNTLYLNFTSSQNTAPYYPEFYAFVDGQLVASGQSNQSSGQIAVTIPATSPVNTTAFPHHSLEVDVKGVSGQVDRWNSQTASLIFNGVTLASGNTLSPPTVASCNLDIYSDSIGEGDWTLGNHASYSTGQDVDYYDGTVGLGGMVRRLTGCEVSVIGASRQGWAYSGVGNVPALSSAYGYLWSGQARVVDASVTGLVIAEGTNDTNDTAGSCASVVSTMASTVPAMASMYSGRPIAIVEPTSGSGACGGQVKSGAAALTTARTTYIDTTGMFTQSESTDSYTLKLHPTAAEELTHLGPSLVNALRPALFSSAPSGQFRSSFFH